MDGGPDGIQLVGGSFKVPGRTADLDAKAEYWQDLDFGVAPHWMPVELKTWEGPYGATLVKTKMQETRDDFGERFTQLARRPLR
jgi:hypothetical protein